MIDEFFELEKLPGLSYQIEEATVFRWGLLLTLTAVFYFTIVLVKTAVIARLQHLQAKIPGVFDDILISAFRGTKRFFILVSSLYLASLVVVLPEFLTALLSKAFMVVLMVQLGFWVTEIAQGILTNYFYRRDGVSASTRSTVGLFSFLIHLVVWSLVLLLALENFGIDITALVAGLGVGGIAVALAVQNVLGDLLGSLSIILDKPFEVGDYIVVGDLQGTVEQVGIKTTRVRSLSGEQLVFANSDLLGSRIKNYKRMNERRVVFGLGVIYETTAEKVKKIPGIIEEIITAVENVRFDRAHFKSFGDFSLNFEVVYYVQTSDYKIFMDAQQEMNFQLFERFGSEGIEFAYPTSKVFMEKEA